MSTSPPAPPPPLFRQRNFSALWWGQLISLLGERLTYLALVGLLSAHTAHFRDLSKSSILLTTLGNVMGLPVLLFSPFTGAWVDRQNLKRVVVVSDLLRAMLALAIPVLYLSTRHTLPVFVVVFVLFTCNVFFLPAKSALTPEIVPASQLLAANAWLSGAGIAATAVGMLGGGWVIDHWGWTTALYFNTVTYLVSVVALLLIRYTPRVRDVRVATTLRSYLAQVFEGWRVVRTNATVGLALTALAAVWVGGGFLNVAGNLHIQRAASAPGMERLAVLVSVLALGSGVSTWWLNTAGKRMPRPWLLGGGLLIAGVGVFAFAVSTRFAVFTGAAFLIGLAAAPAFMLTEMLLQVGTDAGHRGRVFSARDFLMRLVFVVGGSVAGAVTQLFGVQPALLICAAVVAGTGLLAIAWGRRVPALMRPAIADEP